MNNIITALGLTAIIILIVSVFNLQTGYIIEPQNQNSSDECPECNLTCPTCECPEDITPYADCDSCCEEFDCPECLDCPSCDSCCEDCPDCSSCDDCDSCCEECPPEANEQNCEQYCGDAGSEPQPEITYIQYTGADKLDEWVQIEDSGTDMTNWTLSDIANHTYTFPEFIISGVMYVHTGTGEDNETDLFWGSGTAIWNNNGDRATLKNQEGSIVSVYEY